MFFKILIKKISLLLIISDISFNVVNKIFIKYFVWFKKQRHQYKAISELFRDNFTVRYGIFKGMKLPIHKWFNYPEASLISNTLFSKLLGVYESELELLFNEKINKKKYTEIVNIGSAEGYYTVGLGLIHKQAKIYSFDTNPYARKLCFNMSKFNNIQDRVIIGSLCDEKKLKSLQLTTKSLILSDCEGYEKYLFTKNTHSLFKKHDLLIEIHDCVDPSISSYIKSIFKESHNLSIITSLEDNIRVLNLNHNELKSYNISDRLNLIAENRQSVMEWYFFEPK